MAGLQGFHSHGGSTLSWGCLATVKAAECHRLPPSILVKLLVNKFYFVIILMLTLSVGFLSSTSTVFCYKTHYLHDKIQ